MLHWGKKSVVKNCCTNFYCSHLWQCYKKESLRRLQVAYNRVFHTFLKLEHRIIMSAIFVDLDVDHFDILLHKSIVGFSKRISECSNLLISNILRSVFYLKCKMFTSWNNRLYFKSSIWWFILFKMQNVQLLEQQTVFKKQCMVI